MSAALQLPTVTCYSWCEDQDGHPGEWCHDDQWCNTTVRSVPTVLYPSIEQHDHTHQPESVRVCGMGYHNGQITRIEIGRGETAGFQITVAEAKQLAAAIHATVTELEAAP